MNIFQQHPTPDVERFIRTIRGEIIPDRPPMVEYLVDEILMREVVTGFLGRQWAEAGWEGPSISRQYLDNLAAFWRAAGYDYVRLELTAGFTGTGLSAPDTGTKGRTMRNWVNLHKGDIGTWEEFEAYPWPDTPSEEHLDALVYVAEHLPDGMGMITCHAGGIYETVSNLMSYEGLCFALHDNPDLVAAVTERAGQCMEKYYEAFLEMDGLCMVLQGEDLGHRTGLLISEKHLKQYFLPWHKRFAEMTHARGLPYCLHSCGCMFQLMPAFIDDVGIDGKHSFEDVILPASRFHDLYGDRIATMGGVDINILAAGSPEEVRSATRKLIEHCAPKGRFAIGSGNSIPSYIPMENYMAMLEEARR